MKLLIVLDIIFKTDSLGAKINFSPAQSYRKNLLCLLKIKKIKPYSNMEETEWNKKIKNFTDRINDANLLGQENKHFVCDKI